MTRANQRLGRGLLPAERPMVLGQKGATLEGYFSTARSLGKPSGWAVFAGSILMTLGLLNFFWGLAAIIDDTNVIVGGSGALVLDLSEWGWAALIVGGIQVLTGFALFAAKDWARWVGIFFAALAVIGQVGIVTAFPIWSLIIVGLGILVIYNLAVHWDD